MKKVFILLLLVIANQYGFAQVNLVPNPSFELFDTCPPFPNNNLEYALFWFQPNEPLVSTMGSSDFFHVCMGSTNGVPGQPFGYQFPRTGNGHGGFAGYMSIVNDEGHEYIETPFSFPLDSGENYCVSFYLSLSDQYGCCGTSAIGAYLSKDTCQYSSLFYLPINVTPQVINDSDNYLTDTLNWSLVKGIYSSMGNERFMTIGNFWNWQYNSNHAAPCIWGSGVPYYFIDDVSVIKLPEIDAGQNCIIMLGDSASLNGSISEQWPGMTFEWLPHTNLSNPNSLTTIATPTTTITYSLSVTCSTCEVPCLEDIVDSVTVFVEHKESPQTFPFNVSGLFFTDQFFVVTGTYENTVLKIYDSRARLVYKNDSYENDLLLSNFASGIYIYELTMSDSLKYTGKFTLLSR